MRRLAARLVPMEVNVLQNRADGKPLLSACSVARRAVSRIRGSEGGGGRHGRLFRQVHGERSGFNNTDWDTDFLDLIVRDRSGSPQ